MFVDGTLADAALVAMYGHLAECAACSRYDTAIRRGLLVLRNLPVVEPSPDFLERLNDRLDRVREADAHAAMFRGPGVGSFIASVASVMAIGVLAVALRELRPASPLRLPPIVAMRPATAPASQAVSSAFVASASVGLPVWPTAMIAEQAPARFASAEMESLTTR